VISKRTLAHGFLMVAALLVTGAKAPAPAPASGDLRAGASKIRITPPREEMVAPFDRVNDDVFIRALVLESGGKRGVIVIVDAPMYHKDVGDDIRAKIASTARVRPENILFSMSHTHNIMRLDHNKGGIILPGSSRFVEQVTNAAQDAVKQAIASLQPAHMGSGQGEAHLIGPKSSWSPELQRYIEKIDRSGKETVNERLGLIKFESPDGRPIAFLMNYGINPVIAMAMKGEVSGDVPGAAARYVEERAGGDAVALFTVGASGNPLYRAEPDPIYKTADPRALIQAMGTILGEEAIAVARQTPARLRSIPIGGATSQLICPGKMTAPLNLKDRCAHTPDSPLPACNFQDTDTDPVAAQLGVLKIGPIALVQADANISSGVGRKLLAASPLSDTWAVSLNYGPMHYIVEDSEYPLNTYEATATTAKAGCAESGFLSHALDMIDGLE